MDGVKLVTDTIDILTNYGRWASYKSRSMSERICGSYWNENPGGSRIRAE